MTTPTGARLILARHGEVAGNREMRLIGDRDEPLTSEGERQAAELARWLGGLELAGVLASPLRRARDTARAIAAPGGHRVAVEERLREQSYGDWEGMTGEEIRAGGDGEALRGWWRDPGQAPPGGESLASVRRRVAALADELAAAPERAAGSWVLVTHVGPIKALVCAVLELPLEGVGRLFLDPGTYTVVDWGKRRVLRVFNARGPVPLRG